MRTLNISLPTKLSTKVDEIVEDEGYASRSELFRTLLRFYIHTITSKSTSKSNFFLPFKKQPLNKIRKGLTESGLYNQKFIDSVIKGLRKSSVYGN